MGERIVALTKEHVTFRQYMTRENLINGLRYISATGGSTNAVLHLPAIAKVLGVELTLRQFDELQAAVPVVAKFKPSSGYTIYDYHRAGGVAGVLKTIRDYLDQDVRNAYEGCFLREYLDGLTRRSTAM